MNRKISISIHMASVPRFHGDMQSLIFSLSSYIPQNCYMLNLSRLRSISSCGYSNRSLQIIFHSPLLAEWTKSTKVHLYLQLYTYKNTLKPSYFLGGGLSQNNDNICAQFLICFVLSPFPPTPEELIKLGKIDPI